LLFIIAGTGKTHATKGIIPMLSQICACPENKKIVVCAPSNVAVDEIVARLVSQGGMLSDDSASNSTYREAESLQRVLRITSLEYEPALKAVEDATFEGKLSQRFPARSAKVVEELRAKSARISEKLTAIM